MYKLSKEGAKTIYDALDNPPPITDRLRAAAERYNNGGIEKILANLPESVKATNEYLKDK